MKLRIPGVEAIKQNEVVLILVVTTAIVMLGSGIISPILPLYAQSFGVNVFMVGLMVAAYGIARIFMDIPAGRLADRFGRRTVMISGALLMVVSSLGNAVAGAFWQVVVMRLIQGAGSALYVTAAQTALADLSTPRTRGQLLSLHQGSHQIGSTFGPAAGGFLAEFLGLRAPFFAFAGIAAVAALWAYLRIPETSHQKVSNVLPPTPGTANVHRRDKPSASVVRILLMDVSFILIAFISLNNFLGHGGAQQTILPLYATEYLGLTEGQLGLAMTVIGVGNLITTFMAGWLSDRFGRKTVLVPGTIMLGLSFGLFAVSGNVWVFVLAAALTGIARGFSGSVPAAYAADIAPPGKFGATLGIYRTFGDIGFAIGPLLAGWIADSTGSLSIPLFALTGLMVLSAVLFGLFARETVQTSGSPKLKIQRVED